MVRPTDNKMKRVKKRIFNDTSAWMRGELTTYQVMKNAKCTWSTTNKWLNIFKAEIERQKAIIPEKVLKSLEEKRNISTWKKLRNLIVKVALKQKASSTN